MAQRMIVIVTDLDEPAHGEINVVDSAREAARLVETLLEAGFERDRIRVFVADEMDMQVTQRPVVALVRNGATAKSPTVAQAPAQSRQAVAVEARQEVSGRVQAYAAEPPYYRESARFSNVFRAG